MDEKVAVSGISLYPNPTTGLVNLNLTSLKADATIQIVNAIGQVVYMTEKVNGIISVDLSALPNGMYFANIKAGNETFVKKININK
jgi:hypothetical protein